LPLAVGMGYVYVLSVVVLLVVAYGATGLDPSDGVHAPTVDSCTFPSGFAIDRPFLAGDCLQPEYTAPFGLSIVYDRPQGAGWRARLQILSISGKMKDAWRASEIAELRSVYGYKLCAVDPHGSGNTTILESGQMMFKHVWWQPHVIFVGMQEDLLYHWVDIIEWGAITLGVLLVIAWIRACVIVMRDDDPVGTHERRGYREMTVERGEGRERATSESNLMFELDQEIGNLKRKVVLGSISVRVKVGLALVAWLVLCSNIAARLFVNLFFFALIVSFALTALIATSGESKEVCLKQLWHLECLRFGRLGDFEDRSIRQLLLQRTRLTILAAHAMVVVLTGLVMCSPALWLTYDDLLRAVIKYWAPLGGFAVLFSGLLSLRGSLLSVNVVADLMHWDMSKLSPLHERSLAPIARQLHHSGAGDWVMQDLLERYDREASLLDDGDDHNDDSDALISLGDEAWLGHVLDQSSAPPLLSKRCRLCWESLDWAMWLLVLAAFAVCLVYFRSLMPMLTGVTNTMGVMTPQFGSTTLAYNVIIDGARKEIGLTYEVKENVVSELQLSSSSAGVGRVVSIGATTTHATQRVDLLLVNTSGGFEGYPPRARVKALGRASRGYEFSFLKKFTMLTHLRISGNVSGTTGDAVMWEACRPWDLAQYHESKHGVALAIPNNLVNATLEFQSAEFIIGPAQSYDAMTFNAQLFPSKPSVFVSAAGNCDALCDTHKGCLVQVGHGAYCHFVKAPTQAQACGALTSAPSSGLGSQKSKQDMSLKVCPKEGHCYTGVQQGSGFSVANLALPLLSPHLVLAVEAQLDHDVHKILSADTNALTLSRGSPALVHIALANDAASWIYTEAVKFSTGSASHFAAVPVLQDNEAFEVVVEAAVGAITFSPVWATANAASAEAKTARACERVPEKEKVAACNPLLSNLPETGRRRHDVLIQLPDGSNTTNVLFFNAPAAGATLRLLVRPRAVWDRALFTPRSYDFHMQPICSAHCSRCDEPAICNQCRSSLTTGGVVKQSYSLAVDRLCHTVDLVAGTGTAGGTLEFLRRPTGFALAGDSAVYVMDGPNKVVVRWARGASQGLEVVSGISGPSLAFGNNRTLFVTDSEKHCVMQYTLVGIVAGVGRMVAGTGVPGQELSQLNGPLGIAVGPDNSLYVVDTGNQRVMRWVAEAAAGTVVLSTPGQPVNTPQTVAIGRNGALFVLSQRWASADWYYAVDRWDSGSSHGVPVSPPGCSGLAAFAIGSVDTMYFACLVSGSSPSGEGSYVIKRFVVGESEGKIIAGGGSEGLLDIKHLVPLGLVVGSDNQVYVMDPPTPRVTHWPGVQIAV